MAPGTRHVGLPVALHRWTTSWLVCLLLSGCLVLSGCGRQGNTINELNGIVALSSSNVWAVGFATTGQGSRPLIEHWNGRIWTQVPAPSKGSDSVLYSVAARSAKDVWVVGAFDQGRAVDGTLIEHWDGHAWKVVASPNSPGDNVLRSVAVVSATDVWAVGSTVPCPVPLALAAGQQGNALVQMRPAGGPSACAEPPYPPPYPLIEHWDGSAWSIVPSPSLASNIATAYLSKVVALARDNIWAIGFVSYQRAVSPASVLVEHWDGTAWQVMTGFDGDLRAEQMAFLSSNDIWGVADSTPTKEVYPPPTIQHWNGSAWSVVPGPQKVSSSNYGIETMAASGPDDVWAIGGYYYSSSLPSPQDHVFTMHWDGHVWRQVPCPSGEGTGGNITASVSVSPTDAWLVGDYPDSSGPQLTFMEHWNGHAWRLVPNPNPGTPAPSEQ